MPLGMHASPEMHVGGRTRMFYTRATGGAIGHACSIHELRTGLTDMHERRGRRMDMHVLRTSDRGDGHACSIHELRVGGRTCMSYVRDGRGRTDMQV